MDYSAKAEYRLPVSSNVEFHRFSATGNSSFWTFTMVALDAEALSGETAGFHTACAPGFRLHDESYG